MVTFGYALKRVVVEPVGMVHVEQPGQPVGSKYEITISGMTPAESGIIKAALIDMLDEQVRHFNDPSLEEDSVNAIPQ